jgi:hypothetical protein
MLSRRSDVESESTCSIVATSEMRARIDRVHRGARVARGRERIGGRAGSTSGAITADRSHCP